MIAACRVAVLFQRLLLSSPDTLSALFINLSPNYLAFLISCIQLLDWLHSTLRWHETACSCCCCCKPFQLKSRTVCCQDYDSSQCEYLKLPRQNPFTDRNHSWYDWLHHRYQPLSKLSSQFYVYLTQMRKKRIRVSIRGFIVLARIFVTHDKIIDQKPLIMGVLRSKRQS